MKVKKRVHLYVPFFSIYELKKEDFPLKTDKYCRLAVREFLLLQSLRLLRRIKNDYTFHNNQDNHIR